MIWGLPVPAVRAATFRHSFSIPPPSSRSLTANLGIPELHSVLHPRDRLQRSSGFGLPPPKFGGGMAAHR